MLSMFHTYGYGGGMFFGSYWLVLVGIPLIIGLIAQFRVSNAFKKWGAVRASSRQPKSHRSPAAPVGI